MQVIGNAQTIEAKLKALHVISTNLKDEDIILLGNGILKDPKLIDKARPFLPR